MRAAGADFNRADAAMYWKAYSQAKLDKNKEALETVAHLAKTFTTSPWIKDARALALEIQQSTGQPVSVELQNDDRLVPFAQNIKGKQIAIRSASFIEDNSDQLYAMWNAEWAKAMK